MRTTPLSARFWFRNRDYVSVLSGCIVFFILFIVSEHYIGAWLGLFLSLAITLVLYSAVLNNPTIGFKCPHCRQYIESNHPWICGFKQCRNDNANDYPFVYRCQDCGAEPKAYQCHHCGKLIFLTKDKFKFNYARHTRPFKERSDLDIHGLEQDLHKAGLELSIEEVDMGAAVGYNAIGGHVTVPKIGEFVSNVAVLKIDTDFIDHDSEVVGGVVDMLVNGTFRQTFSIFPQKALPMQLDGWGGPWTAFPGFSLVATNPALKIVLPDIKARP